MQTRNRFFDDAARLAGGAAGTLAGIKREVETLARQQIDRLLDGMDLVTREEFEAVKELAANARAGEEALAARVAALEAALAKMEGAKRAKSGGKPRARTAEKAAPEKDAKKS